MAANTPTSSSPRAHEPRYASVAEVTQLLKQVVEGNIPELFFQGEISELAKAGSGHVYFTLKDAAAQLSAVMWSATARNLKFDLKSGLQVLCHGRPTVYLARGRLQVVVDRMVPAGEGELQRRFLELKAKLESEGLFLQDRKRRLPFLPRAVGVVTSAQGAVIHDIMVKFRERMPSLPVYLYDARVQGAGAAEELAQGVRVLSESGLVELIIVARGGGSLEDLWAFNEEILARAIFAARVPVVSGVGHEVDITISDLVADVRAPTPTAAAEMVVPRRSDLLSRLQELAQRLASVDRVIEPLAQRLDELSLRIEQASRLRFERSRVTLSALESRLRSLEPRSLFRSYHDRIHLLERRLMAHGDGIVERHKRLIDGLSARLAGAIPVQRVVAARERLDRVWQRFDGSALRQLRARTERVAVLESRLQALSPQAVLERGYSIVERGGAILRTVDGLGVGDEIAVRVARGRFVGRVTTVLKE